MLFWHLMGSRIVANASIQEKMPIIMSQILCWISTNASGHPAFNVIWHLQSSTVANWLQQKETDHHYYAHCRHRPKSWKVANYLRINVSQILGWISTDAVSSELAGALFQLAHNFQHLLCISHNSYDATILCANNKCKPQSSSSEYGWNDSSKDLIRQKCKCTWNSTSTMEYNADICFHTFTRVKEGCSNERTQLESMSWADSPSWPIYNLDK